MRPQGRFHRAVDQLQVPQQPGVAWGVEFTPQQRRHDAGALGRPVVRPGVETESIGEALRHGGPGFGTGGMARVVRSS